MRPKQKLEGKLDLPVLRGKKLARFLLASLSYGNLEKFMDVEEETASKIVRELVRRDYIEAIYDTENCRLRYLLSEKAIDLMLGYFKPEKGKREE